MENIDTNIFLEKALLELHKLKTLKIYYLNNALEISVPTTSVFHDLEIINIDYITIEAAVCIIENSGGNLREILLSSRRPYDKSDFLILIRKIYENCPLVEYLSLEFPPSTENSTEFKKLLKVCQNLKSLSLIVDKKYKNGKDLLEILVEYAPINLREIRFQISEFSLETLETFLEKWKGRPALSMLTSDFTYTNNTYNKYDYMNLINKYKSVGVINDFRY
jgi:hypothetical protein